MEHTFSPPAYKAEATKAKAPEPSLTGGIRRALYPWPPPGVRRHECADTKRYQRVPWRGGMCQLEKPRQHALGRGGRAVGVAESPAAEDFPGVVSGFHRRVALWRHSVAQVVTSDSDPRPSVEATAAASCDFAPFVHWHCGVTYNTVID